MARQLSQGMLITLEGGEAVGKSTQIQKLKERLLKQGLDVVATREPGGTPKAEAIRKELENPNLSVDEEAELFYQARESHIAEVILPALQSGKIIVCDRFVDSTHVYQGVIRNIGAEWMHKFENQIKENSVNPFITFIFDLSSEETLHRVEQRGGPLDHYDSQGEEFHEAVRQGFLNIAAKNPERCVVVDASQSEEIISDILFERVMEAVQ